MKEKKETGGGMIMKKIFDYVDQNFDRMMEEMKEFCSHRSVAGDKTGLEETRNWIDKKLSAGEFRTNFRKWRMEMP